MLKQKLIKSVNKQCNASSSTTKVVDHHLAETQTTLQTLQKYQDILLLLENGTVWVEFMAA